MSTTPEAGHNSEPVAKFAVDQLRSIVERFEALAEQVKDIQHDQKDILAEAKGNGYDVKALRTIIRLRKQDAAARAEQEAVLETYMLALGMLSDTPLGKAAIERATA